MQEAIRASSLNAGTTKLTMTADIPAPPSQSIASLCVYQIRLHLFVRPNEFVRLERIEGPLFDPVDDFQPSVEVLDQGCAALDPIPVVAIDHSADVADL